MSADWLFGCEEIETIFDEEDNKCSHMAGEDEFNLNDNDLFDNVYLEELAALDDCESGEESIDGDKVSCDQSLVSKNGIEWTSTPFRKRRDRHPSKNTTKVRPGVKSNTKSSVKSIRDAFLLFFPPSIVQLILKNSNNYGRRKFKNGHIDIDSTSFHTYLSVLILAGIYRYIFSRLVRRWFSCTLQSLIEILFTDRETNQSTNYSMHRTDVLYSHQLCPRPHSNISPKLFVLLMQVARDNRQ